MNEKKINFNITPIRKALIVLGAIFVILAIYRLIMGHDAVSNTNDHRPWGIWIGFNVLAGVALAGGGYSTAVIVNILRLKQSAIMARTALLVSLSGYIFVSISLFLDVGQWFNFWRPYFSWAHHSVMFEVFWCISLYTLVQLLEFGEIFTEKFMLKWHSLFKSIMPVLLIIGIVLPILHQSSLGALFLIAKGKLHPIWWSPFLPIFFLISSFFVGPSIMTLENAFFGKIYKHQLPLEVLQKLVRVSSVLMAAYLVLLIFDLSGKGAWDLVFSGNNEGNMFLLEVFLMIIAPLGICLTPGLFKKRQCLNVFAVMVCSGVVLNRLNVSLTGMAASMGGHYFPSVFELLITIGLISVIALVYMFAIENFYIYGYIEKQGLHYGFSNGAKGESVIGDNVQ